MKHAKLGASSSSRWLSCTASVKASEGFKNTSSSFAQYGTDCHELADQCLRTGKNAADFLGETIGDTTITQDETWHVQLYIDYVRDFNGDLYPEQRVDFSNYIPEGFGTADAIVIKDDTCHVIDLKTGKGVEVSAVKNTQGMLYAVGVLNEYDFLYDLKNVVIHIVQPRIHNFSKWEISVTELIQWAEWARGQALEALSDKGVYSPSDKACMWCLAKGTCKALADHTQQVISAQFDDLDCDTERLSDDQRKLILDNKKLIESFLTAVEASVKSQIEDGTPFNGYKLVAGRSARKLKPEAELILVDKLGEDAYNKKLKGLGELEKAIGKKAFVEMDLTVKAEGAPTLAPESDKRQAIDTASLFDKL